MPRRCTVCDHPKRAAIDRAIVTRAAPIRSIARNYGLNPSAIAHHGCEHVPETLARAQEAKDDERATDLMEELEACMTRVRLLFDACDRWLRDADDPTRYDIGPRAEEVTVTYWEAKTGDGSASKVRRKATLSELLTRVAGVAADVSLVETKHADPRELVLKTANQLQSHLELLGQLIGKLEGRTTVNVLVMPQWREVQTALLTALAPYPQARARVVAELTALGGVPTTVAGRRDVQ